MPNIRISDMPLATLPLVGDELLESVQGGFSRQITIDDIIAAAAALDATFITVTANPNLAFERVLTAGNDIALVDGGANSTITIDVTGGGALPVPTISGSTLRGAMGTYVENRQLQITGATISGFNAGETIQYNISHDDTRMLIGENGGLISLQLTLDSLMIDEVAAAPADLAGSGQFWVRDDVPNVPMFTNDIGEDFELGVGAPVFDQFNYQFNDSTAATDPGSGFIAFNNVAPASVTLVVISETDADGVDISTDVLDRIIDAWKIRFQDPEDLAVDIVFTVTNIVDSGTFRTITVAHQRGTTIPANNTPVAVGLSDQPYLAIGNPSNGEVYSMLDTFESLQPSSFFARDDGGGTTNIGTSANSILLLSSASAVRTSQIFSAAFTDANNALTLFSNGGDLTLQTQLNGGPLFLIGAAPGNEMVRIIPSLGITERAAALADVAAVGQIWIRNDVPNTLMFTDDIGADFIVSGALDPTQEAILQYSWLFSTTTAQADPGTNTLRFNNVAPASITFMYIDDTGPNGQDIGSLIVSNFTAGYQFEFEDPTDADTIQRFLVTGTPTDFTGFWRVPVINLSAQSGASLPGDGAAVQIAFDFHQFIDQGTLSGNSKDMLFWDGGGWNNTGSTTRINPNRPAIGGAFALSGSSSADRTTAMLNVQVGNSISGLWFMAGAIATDGGYCHADMIGTETIVWGWDSGAVVDDLLFMDENRRIGITAAAGFVMAEKAADHGNIPGFGEYWVRSTGAGDPMFTDDAGADFVLNASGVTVTGTPVNNQLAVWTAANDIEGDANLTWDGSQLTMVGVFNPDLDGLGVFMQNKGAGTESFGISSDGAGDIDLDFTNVTNVNFNGGDVYDFSNEIIRSVSNLFLQEQAADSGNISNQGQFWVEDTNPNRAMFTTGDGDIHALAISPGEVTLNASHDFNTAGNFAENWIGSYDSGANFTVTLEDSASVVQWPVGTAIQVINPGSGVITIAEGSGVTLFLDDGTDTVGGATVTQGVVTIFRQTTANYIIFGSGIA